MKTLNMDELAKTERTLTVKGVEYPVIEMTVGNFIQSSEAAKKLKDIKDSLEQLQETVALIQRSIPTIPKEVLHGMSFERLYMVVEFIQGGFDEPVTPATDTAAGAEGAQEKKAE